MKDLFFTYQTARKFKEEACELMGRLCRLAKVDVSDPDRNIIFRQNYGKQQEQSLDDQWSFCLHGAECRFTDQESGRELEVIIVNGDQFGALDFFFFSKYLKQEFGTNVFLRPFVDDKTEIEHLLKRLYEEGQLTKLDPNMPDLNRNLSA
jgi:hypothetical protein